MEAASIRGFSSQEVVVGGIRLHVRLGGNPAGPPVVLQHGWAGTSYTWRHVGPLLAEAGCAVLIPDLRGYGDSDKPGGSAGYDGLSLVEDSRATVRELGFGQGRPLTLAAHDMGAPGALLWAGHYPDELSALLYIEEPVLLPEIIRELIVYDEHTVSNGSMWWWLLALAPNAPERIIVGHERSYLEWFYNRVPGTREAVADGLGEYLRTFTGLEGVLGALGVYRGVPETLRQTRHLMERRVSLPVVGVGGSHSRGDAVAKWLTQLCDAVQPVVIDGGHFLPEERPVELAELILKQIRRP